MQLMPPALGRVVVASLDRFEVECFERDTAPPLGALVVCVDGGEAIYGAVAAIVTAGVDPSRPIAPHGTADDDLATVLSRHPHLPVLLRTSFISLVLGHDQGGTLRHYLPQAPPPLFARVRQCTEEEEQRFVQRLDFLQPLLRDQGIGDEVTSAFLRRAGQICPDPHAFLLAAGRALVPLLASEPDRLASIVRRIHP